MYLKVHIYPDSREDKLITISDDLVEAYVRAPAERGLANSAMLGLIRNLYSDRSIRIVSGHLHRHKIVSIS